MWSSRLTPAIGSKSGPSGAPADVPPTTPAWPICACMAAALAWAAALSWLAWSIISGAAATVPFKSFNCLNTPMGHLLFDRRPVLHCRHWAGSGVR